jgi:hypothetical protein
MFLYPLLVCRVYVYLSVVRGVAMHKRDRLYINLASQDQYHSERADFNSSIHNNKCQVLLK